MPVAKTAARRGRPKKAGKQADPGSGTVLALDRGLRVLSFLAEHGGATLTEISKQADMPVATAHRILVTLESRGFAELIETSGQWVIGVQAFRTGNTYQQSFNLSEIAKPIMQELSATTGETSNLAVEDQGELVYLLQVESENPIRASLKSGTASHFHTSGVGKAMLAHMDQPKLDRILATGELARQTANSITDIDLLRSEFSAIRQRGWALDDEERFVGMRCIAAPIFDRFGGLIGGVSISGPSARFPDDRLPAFAENVAKAAERISRGLIKSED